jgi:hypothetical protein
MQRQSTTPFFWSSAHSAGLFNVGDEGRIVIFPTDSREKQIATPVFRAE